MKITLSNDFHETEATVVPRKYGPPSPTTGQQRYAVSHRTAQRLRKELCGQEDCCCGGTFGERGGSYLYVISQDQNRNWIVNLRASNLGTEAGR